MYWHYYHHHFHPHQMATSQGSWDGWITLGTFLAVFVALFGNRFWTWWTRPKIVVDFTTSSERCYRNALAPEEDVQDQGRFFNVKRQFFRLRVINNGLSSVKNLRAKVELYDLEKKELADRFEPNILNWVSGSGAIDLASKEEDYVNLFSQVLEPSGETNYIDFIGLMKRGTIGYKTRIEIKDHSPRGLAWDRKLQNWKLRVTFHGDNLVKPVTKFYEYSSPIQGETVGILKESINW